MAKPQDDPKLQDQNLEIREALNNAYAAVEGQKSVRSFAAYTFEDALNDQIKDIEGPDTALRPNELHRVDRIAANVQAAVSKIKSMPPEAFVESQDERDVNSKP